MSEIKDLSMAHWSLLLVDLYLGVILSTFPILHPLKPLYP